MKRISKSEYVTTSNKPAGRGERHTVWLPPAEMLEEHAKRIGLENELAAYYKMQHYEEQYARGLLHDCL